MKCIFLLMALLLAQGAYTQEQVFVIDLKSQKLEFANRNFYITRVVDARLAKDNIGQVQTGLLNSSKLAVFEHEFSTELQQFFNRNLPEVTGIQQVVLRIIQLRVWEYTDAASEKAYAKLQCQFLQKVPETNEYLVLHQSTASVSNSGLDVTHRHDSNLTDVLQKCLADFASQNYEYLTDKALRIKEDDLSVNSEELDEPMSFAILKDTMLVSGVYNTFADFRKNAPDQSRPLELVTRARSKENWQGTYEVTPYVTDDAQHRRLQNVWGFAYKGKSYINFNGEYYPLHRRGNLFSFDGHIPDTYSLVSTSGLWGGLIGGAIAGAVAANINANSRAEFVLELTTGRVFDVNAYMQETNPVKMVFYWRIDKSSANPVKVLLCNQKDTLATELTSGSMTEMAWSDWKSDVFACIDGKPETCFLLIPQMDRINFFEYFPSGKKTTQAQLKPAIQKEADFYTKQIRYRQEIEAKHSKK